MRLSEPSSRHSLESYRDLAASYDSSCRRIMPVRREAISLLRLESGETVLDVASGTGLSLPLLSEAVGPTGRVIAIEHSPDMMAVARARVIGEGLKNVLLIERCVEDADLAWPIDAVLFHFTHDVLQSPRAVDNIFKALRPGARIAMAGTKLTHWWLPFANLWVLWRARHYLTTFRHLHQPWHSVSRYSSDLIVTSRRLGTGYLGAGTHTRASENTT